MVRHDANAALRDADQALAVVLPEHGLNPEARAALLARLYVLKSRAICGLGDWEGALTPLDCALRESPKDVEVIVQRGRIRRDTGDLHGAFEDFDRALALDAQSSSAYVGRGLAHAWQGNHQAAIADLDRGLELNPEDAAAWSNRGQAHMELGHLAEAERDCRAALRLDPRLNRAYDHMAYALCQQGKLAEALDVITTGLQYHPEDSDLLLRKAWVLVDQDQVPEALDIANAVLARSPDHGGAYGLRGQVHGILGDYVAACADLERATQLDPQNGEILFNLAIAQFYDKQFAASSETLARVLALNPDDEEARQFQERVKAARRAGLSPVASEMTKADMYIARGEYEKAIDELERRLAQARHARNDLAEAYNLILAGSQYARVRKIRKAQRYIQKGIELARKAGNQALVAQGHVELGIVAFGQERFQEAGQHFAEVLATGRATGSKHYEHIGLGNLGGMTVHQQLGTGGIGRMHLENQHVQQGLAMLQQACDIAHQIGELGDEAKYCRNLGQLFLQMFAPLEALRAFERAQEAYRALGTQDPGLDKMIRDIQGSLM